MTSRAAARLLLVVALLACLWDLGGRSLDDLDTARWGQLAREMVRSGEWLVPHRYGEIYAYKPVLYLWAVAGPSALAGEVTPFLVRLPSALGLLLLVLATVRWTRWRGGSATAAHVAGLLVLSTFGLEWLGRAGRLDMLGAGLSVAAAAWLDRAALGRGTRSTTWWAGLFAGAALLTKGPVLLLTPLAVLVLPSPGRGVRERLRAARPLRVLGVGVALALLWFVPAVLQAGWEAYGRKLLVGQAAERIGGSLAQREPPWYYLLGLPLEAAPWAPLYLAAALAPLLRRGRAALGPLAGVAGAGGLLLLFFSLVPVKHHRYLAPVVPLLAMGAAWWIAAWLARARAAEGWRRHGRILACLLGAAALALPALGAWRPELLLPGLAPAAGLAVLAWAAWRGARGGDPRRAFVMCVLHAAVLALLVHAVVRPRLHETQKEAFNRRLAELRLPDVPVYLGPGLTPENVFHGAPEARTFVAAGDPVPRAAGGRALVVCVRPAAAALRDAQGAPGRVLAQTDGQDAWVILGFGYP